LEKSSSELYYAQENQVYRGTVQKEVCPNCRMSCLFFVSLRKEVFPFLSFVVKRMMRVHRLRWRKPRFQGRRSSGRQETVALQSQGKTQPRE
jgi:hypothetical protein